MPAMARTRPGYSQEPELSLIDDRNPIFLGSLLAASQGLH